MMVKHSTSLLAVGRQEVNGLTLELFAPSVMPSRELFSTNNLQYQNHQTTRGIGIYLDNLIEMNNFAIIN